MSDWPDATVKIVKASVLAAIIITVLVMAIIAYWRM